MRRPPRATRRLWPPIRAPTRTRHTPAHSRGFFAPRAWGERRLTVCSRCAMIGPIRLAEVDGPHGPSVSVGVETRGAWFPRRAIAVVGYGVDPPCLWCCSGKQHAGAEPARSLSATDKHGPGTRGLRSRSARPPGMQTSRRCPTGTLPLPRQAGSQMRAYMPALSTRRHDAMLRLAARWRHAGPAVAHQGAAGLSMLDRDVNAARNILMLAVNPARTGPPERNVAGHGERALGSSPL